MEPDIRVVQANIAKLREEIRNMLDRSKHPAMRAKLLEEIVKLKTLNGVKE
jgi:hypothetical protein